VAQAQGLALHDSHAEILAVRGFNRLFFRFQADSYRFLLDEVIKLQKDESYQSPWLSQIATEGDRIERFTFSASSIFLFISGPPCGDASLDLLAEDPDNAIPWARPTESEPVNFRGHEFIWERGNVRSKPGSTLDKGSNFAKVGGILLKRCLNHVRTNWQ